MGLTPGPGELETSNGWLTTVEKLKKILRSIKCERSKFLRLINSSFETEVVDVAVVVVVDVIVVVVTVVVVDVGGLFSFFSDLC